MNTGNYIIGTFIGFLYLESKEKISNMKKTFKMEAFVHLCWIAGILISILGFPFFELDIENSIFTALFGGFMKHYHGFLLGIAIMGIILRYGGVIPKFFNLPMWRVMGRISYSYFICHMTFVKLFITSANQILELSEINSVIHLIILFTYITTIFIQSFIVACIHLWRLCLQ